MTDKISSQLLTLRVTIFSVVSLLAMLPMFFFDSGGDILFHYTLIQCYAEQFWQGDFYPRWCFDANAGLGSPLFLFYFPLPYLITSLLYPLHKLGVSVEQIYLCGVFLATFVSGLTAWVWLKEITTPRKALLCALVYLLMPYRMEVMLYRSAYAELWVMAWLPMVMRSARMLTLGKPESPYKLAFWLTLCMLTHIPCTFVIIVMAGVYLCMNTSGLGNKFHFLIAVILAVLATSFFTVPGWLYLRYISTGTLHNPLAWPNNFVSMDNLTELGQGRILINLGLTILAAVALYILYLVRQKNVEDPAVRREALTAGLMCGLGILLLFPVTEPAWELLGPLSTIAFPWRMQLMLMTGTVLLFTIVLHWQIRPRKTSRVDGALFIGMLMLLSLFVVTERDPEYATLFSKIIDAHFVTQREYRSAWTPEEAVSQKEILARAEIRSTIPHVKVVHGVASIKTEQWGWKGITLNVSAVNNSVLRLDHMYFPLWNAVTSTHNPLRLTPEKGTGQMLVDVPPGDHWITFSLAVEQPGEITVRSSYVVSLLAFFYILLMSRQREVIYGNNFDRTRYM